MNSKDEPQYWTRRQFVRRTGLLGLAGAFGGGSMAALAATATSGSGSTAGAADQVTMPFAHGERRIVQYPQKRPLILLTSNAIQLETPMQVFDEGLITPNDAFFVRYHTTPYPRSIDVSTYRIRVRGNVSTALSLSVQDLKTQFDAQEIVAVNSCTGNSRGLNVPRVAGGQWGNGAMGNARWVGVSLRDVLNKAGVKAGSVQVAFNGIDRPEEDEVPDFQKALDMDVAMNGDVMIAYQMNGEDIPMLNGYPVKLVVPGYTGTYWVKQLVDINVLTQEFTGFWYAKAYREPDNACACVPPGTAATATKPVSHPRIRSFITNLQEDAMVMSAQTTLVRGIAFDGGSGIKSVLFSADDGATWQDTTLGENLGRYSFRGWQIPFTPNQTGQYALKVKAVANSGETQPETAFWQPAGYGYNPIETVHVTAI